MVATAASSIDTRSQAFYREFENIGREVQGSVEGNIFAPWFDNEDAPLEFHILYPSLKGDMP